MREAIPPKGGTVNMTERYLRQFGAAWDPIPGLDEDEDDTESEEDVG